MLTVHPDDHVHREQNRLGQTLFEEVISRDDYGLRWMHKQEKFSNVRSVIDVGANVGYFSILAACLFPKALRIAIEPQTQNYELLVQNLNDWFTIPKKCALGDGRQFFIEQSCVISGCDKCIPCEKGETESIKLSSLLLDYDVPKSDLIIKLDCEGGEFFLLDDHGLSEWLTGNVAILAEVHCSGDNTKDKWESWIHSIMPSRSSVDILSAGEYQGTLLYNYRIL